MGPVQSAILVPDIAQAVAFITEFVAKVSVSTCAGKPRLVNRDSTPRRAWRLGVGRSRRSLTRNRRLAIPGDFLRQGVQMR
jgi:hypothetical protein